MRQESGTPSLHAPSHPEHKSAVRCRLFGHRRSAALAFTQGDGIWRSRCKRCGEKMVRVGRRHWAVDGA